MIRNINKFIFKMKNIAKMYLRCLHFFHLKTIIHLNFSISRLRTWKFILCYTTVHRLIILEFLDLILKDQDRNWQLRITGKEIECCNTSVLRVPNLLKVSPTVKFLPEAQLE